MRDRKAYSLESLASFLHYLTVTCFVLSFAKVSIVLSCFFSQKLILFS